MNWRQNCAQALGGDLSSLRWDPVGGGSINQTFRVRSAGNDFFVKHHPSAPPDFFLCETAGLKLLRQSQCIRIPQVLAQGNSWLALEWIDGNSNQPPDWESLGRQLACLHRLSAPRWGLAQNNYIGSLVQTNTPMERFSEFFWCNRLEPLLKSCPHVDSELRSRFDRLAGKFGDLLDIPGEHPALLHGDLWSGNLLFDESGRPCLIDPAVHYGQRESELAFMGLFGGFDQRCFKNYQESFPLSSGHMDRWDLYNLYPLLVHLQLFGSGYLTAIHDILRRHV